jgi:hypothetical protein
MTDRKTCACAIRSRRWRQCCAICNATFSEKVRECEEKGHGELMVEDDGDVWCKSCGLLLTAEYQVFCDPADPNTMGIRRKEMEAK